MGDNELDGSCGTKPKKYEKIFRSFIAKSGIPVSSATPDEEFYPLDDDKRMGTCLIFNHKTYECGLRARTGTDKDKEALQHFFENYGFDVKVHNDKKAEEISDILETAKSEDHENACCFVCCILTHGDFKYKENTEVLYAKDTYYPTDNLFTPFLNCRSLVNKPKMFFIQACRGSKTTEGMDIFFKHSAGSLLPKNQNTGVEQFLIYTIPKEADFLIAHSTVPGHYAWKNLKNGSWFIQELCKALEERAGDLDLESILTIVRRKVAFNYETKKPGDPEFDKKKQIPSLYTTLTRRFKFPLIQ